MKKNNRKIFLFFIFFAFLFPSIVFALEIWYPPIPGFPGIRPPQDFVNDPNTPPEDILPLYVTYFYTLIIFLGIAIASLVFVYGGILYIASYLYPLGKPEWITSAKEKMSAAFFGLLILLSSYLILYTINPQLIIFNLPKLSSTEIPGLVSIPQYVVPLFHSSINVEIPFGPVAESILSDKDYKTKEAKPPLESLKNTAQEGLGIAKEIRKNSEELNKATESCKCENKKVSPRCNLAACSPIPNIPLKITDKLNEDDTALINAYNNGSSCSGDPCEKRSEIIRLESENKKQIEKLEQIISSQSELHRILRTELGKIEMAEKFMEECPLNELDSLRNFSQTIDFLSYNKWFLGQFEIWDSSNVEKEPDSFYCQISGDLGDPTKTVRKPPDELPSGETGIKSEKISCDGEIPAGEIIDRAKRIVNKLIERTEKLLFLEKNLITAADKMQILISKCTSQTPMCNTKCEMVGEECLPSCQGNPCPSLKIAAALLEIQKIVEKKEDSEEGIKDVLEAKISENNNSKNIGISQILDQVIPTFIKDLANQVRKPMNQCLVEDIDFQEDVAPNWTPERPEGDIDINNKNDPRSLLDTAMLVVCDEAKNEQGKEGLIEKCCSAENSSYNECLEKCYLESNYKICLNKCLKEQDQKYDTKDFEKCHHKLNFFCCR